MLYPFSEKPLLIPVGRRTSYEVRAAGRRHSRGLYPQDTDTYEWRLWTPPSTCAEEVLFSNLSSPEYIMALKEQMSDMGSCLGPAPLPMSRLPNLPDLGQTLGTNVLTGVLDASDQIGDKFVDGPFVLHSPRHPLGHFDFVSFTAGKGKKHGQGQSTNKAVNAGLASGN